MKKKKKSELFITETKQKVLIIDTRQYFQVDFLKAAMIFLVIFDHMVSWGVKSNIAVTLWERISIPVFLVIMGFNMGISFQRKGDQSLKELYSWNYFKSKILRYIVPFLVLYGFSTLLGLILYQFNISEMYHGQYYPSHGFMNLFIGILPFWGPGNWFLPLIFQSIIILPLLYKALTKKPNLTLILCFIIEIAMHLAIFFFIGNLYPGSVISWSKIHMLNMFMTSILFYLPAIGFGMWFSFGYKLEQNRNFFMWIIYPISLAFICAYQFFGFRIMIGGVPLLRGDYHFLISPYSAFLFLLAMKCLPQNSDNKFSHVISLIGRSTYHILLTQILGYGIIYALRGTHYLIDVGFTFLDALNLIYAWLLFISFGILWFKIDQEKNLIRRLLYYINFFLIFSVIIFFIYVTLIPPEFDWVPLPLIIILIYALIGLTISFVTKKPIRTTTIALWTSFLVYDFFITILYIAILPPTEYLIQNISISTFFVFVVIGTVLDYTIKN
ncbi:MAG: acyltransferase family protein [Candidatus Hodarchaeota archaeon]